jgi:transcriptional regulator PpsR
MTSPTNGSDQVLRLLQAAADITLVIDKAGMIRQVLVGQADFDQSLVTAWVGKAWIGTVTVESRPKISDMLTFAASAGSETPREINHETPAGDLPIRYTLLSLGSDGTRVAVGRDLRSVWRMQQRLLETQNTMERDYARLRQAETRFRLLFQQSGEAVLTIDSQTQRVTDANPAALAMLGQTAGDVIGKPALQLAAKGSQDALLDQLITVRTSGRADDVHIQLGERGRMCRISAAPFRQDKKTLILLRLHAAGSGTDPAHRSSAAAVMQAMPHGFVVTDGDHTVIEANPVFIEMAGLVSAEQVRGQPIGRWLGRPGVDINVLLSNLRQLGMVRDFETLIQREHGGGEDVAVTAVAVPHETAPLNGFIVRRARPQAQSNGSAARIDLPQSVESMTALVGRMSLKELVRETTDIIEKLCIEAALGLTNDNRASAAQLLGVSRQNLYAKLRRFGIDDADEDEFNETNE